jgi:hypothetical protein
MRGGVSCSVHAVWLETAGGARRSVVVRRYGEDWKRARSAISRTGRAAIAIWVVPI